MKDFGVSAVEGMQSPQLVRTTLDGNKQIVFNPSDWQRQSIERCTFAPNEVWSIDLCVTSSADGKHKPSETLKTTIYKRNEGPKYDLKLQASRKTFSEIIKKCEYMPFNLRSLTDAKKARVGLIEPVKHALLMAYDVLETKHADDLVAQVMCTVLIQADGTPLRITNAPECAHIKTDKVVKSAAVKAILDGTAA